MASKKTPTKDPFGLRKGTNTHKAATMFAKGATMADVKTKTGMSLSLLKFARQASLAEQATRLA